MYKYSEALKWGDEGWGGGGDFYKHIKEAALVIMAPQGNLLDMPGCGGHHFAPMNESQLLTDLSKRCGRTSLQAKTTPEWTRPELWSNLLALKSVAPLDLSHLWRQKWVAPLLSALLLLLLMVFVGVRLKGFLPLRWKNERRGRKYREESKYIQVLNLMNNTWGFFVLTYHWFIPVYMTHTLKRFIFAHLLG